MTAPVPCRQCGEPVPHDREGWATPVCYACIRPIKGDLRGPVEVLARRVPCRQCGETVPHDREQWATPTCHACLPPIVGGGEPLAKRGSYGRPSPHPEGSSAEPAVAVPGVRA